MAEGDKARKLFEAKGNNVMGQPRVSVIMVNWNGLEDTAECLESLQKIDYPNCEVIVVDNNSDGNDVDVLESKFGNYIHLIRSEKNCGGSGGYNIGVRYVLENSDADYLLILDNDVVVDKRLLSELVGVAMVDSSVGIASAMVCYYGEPERFTFGWEKSNLWELDTALTFGLIAETIGRKVFRRKVVSNGSVKEVQHVGFWCVLLNRKCVEAVGLFTDEYRGFETIDYSIRVREAGYRIVQVPRAKVWHKFRSAKRIDGAFQFHSIGGYFRFMKKYATLWQYRFFLLQFFVVHFWMATVYYLIWHHPPSHCQ